MYRIKKAAAAIYGWDRPLLTFIYPGFDCGSTEEVKAGGKHGKGDNYQRKGKRKSELLGGPQSFQQGSLEGLSKCPPGCQLGGSNTNKTKTIKNRGMASPQPRSRPNKRLKLRGAQEV